MKNRKKLFVNELQDVKGAKSPWGGGKPPWAGTPGGPRSQCPDYTTLACGEEAFGCSGC